MTVRSVVITALAGMAAVAIIIALRPLPRSDSHTTPPTTPPTAPTTATTPETHTATPRRTPQGSTTSRAAPATVSPPGEVSTVRGFVAEFAAAFARPAPARQQQWRATVPAYLDESTRAAVSTLTASMVPYREVTGPPVVTTGQFPHRATVPTEAGNLLITVCRDHSGEPGQDQRLLVCGIKMEHH